MSYHFVREQYTCLADMTKHNLGVNVILTSDWFANHTPDVISKQLNLQWQQTLVSKVTAEQFNPLHFRNIYISMKEPKCLALLIETIVYIIQYINKGKLHVLIAWMFDKAGSLSTIKTIIFNFNYILYEFYTPELHLQDLFSSLCTCRGNNNLIPC